MKIPHVGTRTREEPLYGPGVLPADAVRPHTYEGIIVGELMGPIEYHLKEDSHRKSCETIEVYHRWFWDESPWGPPLLLPCETWCQARVLSRWKYGPMNRQLWTAATWEFYKPAFVGQKLTAWLRVLDKYWKRNKPYVLTESWCEDEKGNVVHRGVEELLLFLSLPPDVRLHGGQPGATAATAPEPSSQGKAESAYVQPAQQPPLPEQAWPPPRKGAASLQASRETPVGFALPGRSWTVQFRRAWETEHWTDNVHRADGIQKHGFKSGLPEGDHITSKLIEPLVGFFGEEWYRSGRISIKVLPMYGGDVLQQTCVVREKVPEKAGVRFHLDVALVKPNGDRGLVGTASCVVP